MFGAGKTRSAAVLLAGLLVFDPSLKLMAVTKENVAAHAITEHGLTVATRRPTTHGTPCWSPHVEGADTLLHHHGRLQMQFLVQISFDNLQTGSFFMLSSSDLGLKVFIPLTSWSFCCQQT